MIKCWWKIICIYKFNMYGFVCNEKFDNKNIFRRVFNMFINLRNVFNIFL